MARANIIHRLEENWQVLLEAIEGLTEAEMLEPGVCGEWSVRDILGHISTWENEALRNIPTILRGETTPRYSQSGGIAAFNEHAQHEKREYTLSRIKRDFYATHQKFIVYLSELPEVFFNTNPRFIKRIRLDGYNHYLEHAGQIARWRDSRYSGE